MSIQYIRGWVKEFDDKTGKLIRKISREVYEKELKESTQEVVEEAEEDILPLDDFPILNKDEE